MKKNPVRAKFDAALAECGVHARVLADAASRLPAGFAADQVGAIDAEQRRLLDLWEQAQRFATGRLAG